MPKVSVVIVNYNTKVFLEKCLNNLKGVYPNMEIIVVDNASPDGSADLVEKSFPEVTLIRTGNNGLAAGYNLGLKESTGDYILYLGTDAFPGKEAVSGMVKYFENNPKVGVATPKLVLRDGAIDPDCHRGFPTPWAALTHFSRINTLFPKSNLFNQYFLGYKDFDKPHEIDLCISHFMFVRRKVFEDVGIWDENFFVYGEDVDFCFRVKKNGWKIMYLPKWSVLHFKGVGVGIRKESKDVTKASKKTKMRMRKETTRAMKIFYKKHYSDKYPRFLTGFVLWGIGVLEFLRTFRVTT